MQPYTPRFLRIYGIAEIVQWQPTGGETGPYLRIRPTVSWSWNLAGKPFTGDASSFVEAVRRTVHQPPA
jgi:pyridoxamine 5'-phosphate oxidase family protein